MNTHKIAAHFVTEAQLAPMSPDCATGAPQTLARPCTGLPVAPPDDLKPRFQKIMILGGAR